MLVLDYIIGSALVIGFYNSISKLPASKNDSCKEDSKSDRMVLKMQNEEQP
jgi:hypothetical protein